MQRINYTFTAKTPLAHFGETNMTNVRIFRRQRVNQPADKTVVHQSRFKSETSRCNAIIAVLKDIYESIDAKRRTQRIWSEFAQKIYICAIQSDNQFTFLNRICQAFEISTLRTPQIITFLNNFHAQEFLTILIDELQYLIACVRLKREESKTGKDLTLFTAEEKEAENLEFKKDYADVPYISGNAIRGICRRLLMYDFCDRINISRDIFNPENDAVIPEALYHQLFTGGVITEATGFEDIETREEFIRMCPPIGLLGSAIGNMTIRGKVAVGEAHLHCREMQSGDKPYYKFLDVTFATRHDSAKTETEIAVQQDDSQPHSQMIYYHEVITPGAVFDHSFVLKTGNTILESCFWHMLGLLQSQPFIGGMGRMGYGEIEPDYVIPENANDAYCRYVADNSERMQNYFVVSANEAV